MLSNKKHLKATLTLLGLTSLLANCAPNGLSSNTSSTTPSTQSASSTETPAAAAATTPNVKISLTSVANPNLQNLFLNIARVDAILSQGNQTATVNIAQNLGVLDLQSLQNGLTSQLANLSLPAGFNLQQLNLVLGQSGNTAVAANGSQCQLQLPGGLGNILPLNLGQGLNISNNSVFNLLLGLDTSSAVTSAGNGTCAFNPIMGLASAYKFDLASVVSSITGSTGTNVGANLGSILGGSLAGLSNPQDILKSLLPQLGQLQNVGTSGANGLGGVLGSILNGLAGSGASGSATSSGALISTLLSSLLANGGIQNAGSAATIANGQVSLPINLSTGQFATGSGVGTLISSLLQQQVSNNSSVSNSTFGNLNSPLQLVQLLTLFGK